LYRKQLLLSLLRRALCGREDQEARADCLHRQSRGEYEDAGDRDSPGGRETGCAIL